MSFPTGLIRIFCRGSSMRPTLKAGDVLLVRPYCGQRPLRGDVVVFRTPERKSPVVHRVLYSDEQGIKTIGDNNDSADPAYLQPGDIIGRVVCASGAGGIRRLRGGRIGALTGRLMRLRRALDMRLSEALHPLYGWLAYSGIFRRWPLHPMRTRVVTFTKNEEREFQLVWGARSIGRFLPEIGAWAVRRPFKLFIDPKSLSLPDSVMIVNERIRLTEREFVSLLGLTDNQLILRRLMVFCACCALFFAL